MRHEHRWHLHLPVDGLRCSSAATHPPETAEANPPLTTVRQDLDAAGQALVERLLAKLAGQVVEPVLLPTTLIARGTTRSEVSPRPQRPA